MRKTERIFFDIIYRQMNNIEVTSVRVGQLDTNCYLVMDKKTRELIVVDPGDDGDFIMRKISDLDAAPLAVIATHAHFDHILGVNELVLAYKIPFLMHKDDEELLSWMRKSTRYFAGFDPGPAPVPTKFLTEEKNLKLGSIDMNIIHTPGHTPGSIGLHFKDNEILLSGDTIFAGGAVGRTDFPYSDTDLLTKSVMRLMALPDDTVVYPGHEEETTIGEFKSYYNTI